MAVNNQYPDFGDYERNEERAHLARAVDFAHDKLILAQKRQQVTYGYNDDRSSYRFVVDHGEEIAGSYSKVGQISLVPPSNSVRHAWITRLDLSIPLLPAPQNEALLSAYEDKYHSKPPFILNSSEPRYVPTNDIFGIATNAEGETMSFLLHPTDMRAIGKREDIIPSGIAQLYGEFFEVEPDLDTHELQTELLNDWLTPASIAVIMDEYEPIEHGGLRTISGAA